MTMIINDNPFSDMLCDYCYEWYGCYFLFVMAMIINKKHPVKWWEKLGLIAGNVQGLPNVGSIVKVVLI